LSRTRILLATTNQGKLREIKKYLAGLPVHFVSLRDLGIAQDVKEDGRSFRENARRKSLAYSLRSGLPTLAEDSGLEVEHLGGAPGVFSARFSAPRPTDEKNIRKVLRLMKDVPWSKRQARFVSYAVFSSRGRVLKEARGQVRGFVALEKKGGHGFGYDPVFYYSRWEKTFGQVPALRKNKVSHRGRALEKIKVYLAAYLAQPKRRAER
jgi:XTP/dITP diphosphohydrolase